MKSESAHAAEKPTTVCLPFREPTTRALSARTAGPEKNNTEFKTWLEQNYADADKLKAYREKHYIPDVGVEFTNFEEFFLEREKLLVKALKAALI